MIFEEHVETILRAEISSIIKQQGYVLETEMCTMLCKKYNLALHTVRGTLRRIYPGMALIKRRMSGEQKAFYGLEVRGYPIVYLWTTQNSKNEVTNYKQSSVF